MLTYTLDYALAYSLDYTVAYTLAHALNKAYPLQLCTAQYIKLPYGYVQISTNYCCSNGYN
jgi:hypothetical protein